MIGLGQTVYFGSLACNVVGLMWKGQGPDPHGTIPLAGLLQMTPADEPIKVEVKFRSGRRAWLPVSDLSRTAPVPWTVRRIAS